MSPACSQHSRPVTMTVLCCMEAKLLLIAIIILIHACLEDQAECEFLLLCLFLCQPPDRFSALPEYTVHPLAFLHEQFLMVSFETHTETQTFLFVCSIYCVQLKYKLTEIFCWVNRWLFQGTLGEIPHPTPFLRHSVAENQNQTSSDKKLCNYFWRGGQVFIGITDTAIVDSFLMQSSYKYLVMKNLV